MSVGSDSFPSADLIARMRNRINMIRHGVPTDLITPLVQTDLFQAHRSLFEFAGAFGVGRKTLVLGAQAAFAAACIKEQGASSVIGIVDSPRARNFAVRHFSIPGVVYAAAIPPDQYDLVIALGATTRNLHENVARNGKLIVALRPLEEDLDLGRRLKAHFQSVRRLVHVPIADVDFRRATRSTLSTSSFSFRELEADEAVPEEAITLLLFATNDDKWVEPQLHIGCGPVTLNGWVNIDNQAYVGVDFLWDVSRGIPFRNAKFVFAEHFIEHLSYQQATQFARECRAALREDGVFRLSTPNLDWVFITSYHLNHWPNDDSAINDCFQMNRAFRAWGHQFLYNFQAMSAMLQSAGFAHVKAFPYGLSDTRELCGLEHHEQYPDAPTLPHVIVAEARGIATGSISLPPMAAEFERDMALR